MAQRATSMLFDIMDRCSQSCLEPAPAPLTPLQVNYADVDAIFCCLPHATTQEVIKKLPSHLKIVDLSADFRLRNVATYAEW